MALKCPPVFYWEAKRRLRLLTEYRGAIDAYYHKAHWETHGQHWDDDVETEQIRRRINEGLQEIGVVLEAVNISAVINYGPPPITGRPPMDISLLENVFNLPRAGLPHTDLLDQLDVAIGVYRSCLKPLWWKLFNPFYWLGWVLYWIASIPFRIMDAIGFDGAKAERSVIGRIIKGLIQLGTLVKSAFEFFQWIGS